MTAEQFKNTVIPQWYRIGGKNEQLPSPEVFKMVYANFNRLFPYVTIEQVVRAFDNLIKGNIKVEHFGVFSELYLSNLIRESIEYERIQAIKNPKPKPVIEASHQIEAHKIDLWESLEIHFESWNASKIAFTPVHTYNLFERVMGFKFPKAYLDKFTPEKKRIDVMSLKSHLSDTSIQSQVCADVFSKWETFKLKYKK